MAGGKETPRQKMIGMMYLVLTALLALNVSKAILDAFVAIEENIQISNETEYQRGMEKLAELKDKAQDGSEPAAQRKAKKLLETIKTIDKLTAERIKEIDALKIEILDACGEDTKTVGGKESIIQAKYPNDPLKPMRMKLDYVEGKDKFDEAMHILIGEDITAPQGKGIALWNHYNAYRGRLTELVASSNEEGGKHFFKAPKINKFKDQKDLSAKIDQAINGSNVHDDDKEAIKKIYASLTKQERSEVQEIKNVHWIGKTFDHSPSVAALASLSSMQKEILTARADAISLLRARVGAGEFTFNSIMSLAYGPEVINQGEEAEIEVLMAAYDSDRTPTIMLSGKQLPAEQVSNGKGRIKVKGAGSEMSLSGSITIVNKSGIPKTLPWEKKIRVMQPSGTVSLPKMNVLYRNYPNILQGVASGYEETILQGGNGLQLRKEGDHFVGTISSTTREASVTISGRNKSSGKTQQLGVFKFRVMNLPKPSLFLGTFSNGQSVAAADVRAARNIFSKYPSDILLDATFTTGNWEIELSGNPRIARGSGKTLNDAAIGLLKQAKPSNTITITGKFSGPASGFSACVIKVI